MSKLKKVILSGILLAVLIVLNRFVSIKTPLLVISFSFVPIMMAAIWLGPKYSTFTVSAGLAGLIYGIFLYKKENNEMSDKKFIIRLIISNLLVLGIVEIFVVSLWLNMLYGKAYLVVVSTRVLAQVIMFPIRIVTIFALEKLTRPIVNRYLYEGAKDED